MRTPRPPDSARALVVDDAAELRDLVAMVLGRDGLEVETAADGTEAIAAARAFAPDVIVLDVGLPDTDGFEVCRRLRGFTDAYVVMLSGHESEQDKLTALSAGADDYVVKPFSAPELVARIRAMLRRPRAVAAPGPAQRRVGRIAIDIAAREVRLEGSVVDLTPIEFDLLEALSDRPGVALTRAQLLERVWGPNWFGDDHLVDVHVSNLRHKLGDDARAPRQLRTVRGVGYRLDPGADPA